VAAPNSGAWGKVSCDWQHLCKKEALCCREAAWFFSPYVCLCLATTVQYVERSLLLWVTSASDPPVRTVKFSSLLLSVRIELPIINKIHLSVSHCRPSPAINKLSLSVLWIIPPSKCWGHFAVQQAVIVRAKARYWSKILPQSEAHCHKVWHPTVKIFRRCVYSFRRNTRTWQTDGHRTTANRVVKRRPSWAWWWSWAYVFSLVGRRSSFSPA